ncbi:MAG: hypothetical protein J6T18_09060 [Bacteroidaceae bacterium]|nr:hypothetical protein [Bacteroidaceae bacterium]MBO7589557.1 hypothetical protein [Bacteroidaceae bacterium]MBP5647245.1 hypothetical protein [Bacteroidaceae bacterium]
MKRIYSKPATQVVDIRMTQILCGSKSAPKRWGGEFGQVPGMNAEESNLMA